MDERKLLNSWKEIAAYVGRGVRTVQRYELELGLPVRRPAATSRSSVMAFSDELDGWLNSAPIRASIANSIEASAAAQSTTDQNGEAIPNADNLCPQCRGTGRIPSPITHKSPKTASLFSSR